MKSGTFLGVAAVAGTMLAADAQAVQGERMRGAGATRVGAIRSMEMDGFRASEIRGFRGARTISEPRFVSERRVITSRPVAYRSRSEFIRPARRVARPVAYRRTVVRERIAQPRVVTTRRMVAARPVAYRTRSEFIRPARRVARPVAYRRAVVRERIVQPRFVTTRRLVAARPVIYRTDSEFIRPSRRLVRSEFVRPVTYRRTVVRERIAQPRFVTTRRLVAARPVIYRTDGEFIRPSRRVVRSEFVRPVTFRRGGVIRERRLSSLRFADRDRFIVRRNVAFRDRDDWRFRGFRRAPLVSSAYAPAYYYPTTYNYPAEYYTPSTAYTTVQTVPRYTFALAGTSTVLSVQTELARLGYYEGPLDGLMGPMTRSAILRYERDNGLPRFATINRSLLISLGLA